jgi:hypothetical protein
MAIREDCNRQMTIAASCDIRAIELAGERFELSAYRPPRSTHDPSSLERGR